MPSCPGANHFFEDMLEPLISEVGPVSTNGSASLRASPSRRALRAAVIGFEQSRLAMVLSVLEAHGGLKLDVFVEDFAKHQSWAHSILSAS
jgi:hypothetical protein